MSVQITSIEKLRKKYAPIEHSYASNGQKVDPLAAYQSYKLAKQQKPLANPAKYAKKTHKIVGKIQIKGRFSDPNKSINTLHSINNQPLAIPKPKTKTQLKREEAKLDQICNIHMLKILRNLYMKALPSKDVLRKAYILSNFELFIKITFGSCPLSTLLVETPNYLIQRFQRSYKQTTLKDLKDFAEQPKLH